MATSITNTSITTDDLVVDSADNLLKVDHATNKVGIGTESPNSRLEVNETIAFSNADTFAQLNVKTTSGNLGNMLNIGVDETNELSFLQSMKRGTGYKPLILQRYGGNVGIHTTDPTENLEIKTSGPALKLTDTANSNNNIKMSQGYNSYLTASNNIYMTAGGHSDMLNLIDGAVQVKKTRAGAISSGTSNTGAVIKLHTEGQWESGYGNNELATTNDYLGGIEFHSGDNSTGEGLRAAIRGTVDSYYNQNSIVMETADGATAAEPIERMRIWYNGVVTKPYHPCFGCVGFPSHRYMNTWHGVDLNDWNFVYQRNTSHYNNSNGRFTAPVDGMYSFYYHSMFTNPSTNDYHVQIKINGSALTYSNEHSGGGSGNGHQWNGASVELTVNLNAGDYATCASVGNSSSTCYLYGSGTSSRYSSWGGYLLG